MWQFVKSLFATGPKLTPEQELEDRNPGALATIMNEQDGVAGRAQASDVDQARQIHDQFLETVCARPGVRLVDALQAVEGAHVIEWFRPETPEPEPKALMQLFVELARRGQTLDQQPGFDIFVQGRWSQGGGPSDASFSALQYVVKAVGRPIYIYFQDSPSSKEFRISKIELE